MEKVLIPQQTIQALTTLGEHLSIRLHQGELDQVLHEAYLANNFFTREFTSYAIEQIFTHFLDKQKLHRFAESYTLPKTPLTIAIIMAGNIPLAGFHDWLCVMLAGHRALVKCSSKDVVLFRYIIECLKQIDPELANRTVFSERLSDFDAIIATGSTNTNRYFDYYFGKYPHIFRSNRSSVAVITGNESDNELLALGTDIFMYFGLGCRSVSKVFVPEAYDVSNLLHYMEPFAHLAQHTKYMNNYDYNRTILLMNKVPHLANDIICLTESKSVHSSIAILHYEFYADTEQLHERLRRDAHQIQTIVGKEHTPFGGAQQPALDVFADHMDTMQFLCTLSQ
jgi:hypothetical protein